MNFQAFLLSLLLITITGGMLAYLMLSRIERPTYRRLVRLPVIASLNVPLGVGLTSCVSLMLLQFGWLPGMSVLKVQVVFAVAIALICAPLLITAMWRCEVSPINTRLARFRQLTTMHPRMHKLLMLAYVAQILATVAVIDAYLRGPTGQYDAWAIWNMRAHFMYVAGDDWRLAFDPAMAWSHPDYPLLLPLAVWNGWHVMGAENIYWPAAIAIGFGASAALALFSFASVLAGTTRGVLVVIYLLTLPFFADMATWQYADMPLACYMVAALGATALAWQQRKPAMSLYILAGALAGFAAFTKNEGLVFAGALTLSLAIGLAMRKQWRSIAAWLAGLSPGLLCVAVHKLTLSGASDLVGSGDRSLVASLFDVQRHSLIAQRAADIVPDALQPLLLIALVAALLLAPGRSGLRHPGVLLVTGFPLLLMLLAYDAAYLVSPNDLTWHLNTSLDRLVLQWLPMALLWLALGTRWLGAKGYGLGVRRGDEGPGSG